MGYLMRNGSWADTEPLLLFGLGSPGDAASPPVELGDRAMARLTLYVERVTGEALLQVRLETSETAEGPWRPAGGFGEHNAPGVERAAFGPLDRWLRAVSEVTGSGEVTFGPFGEAA